jgi:hypothetical protein
MCKGLRYDIVVPLPTPPRRLAHRVAYETLPQREDRYVQPGDLIIKVAALDPEPEEDELILLRILKVEAVNIEDKRATVVELGDIRFPRVALETILRLLSSLFAGEQREKGGEKNENSRKDS